MRAVAEALYSFFRGFEWDVYPEDGVPGGAALPYITVRFVQPAWQASAPFYIRVWDRQPTPDTVYDKADEIRREIGAGACVPLPQGALWIYLDDTGTQKMPFAGDPTYQCAYMSLTMQAITP